MKNIKKGQIMSLIITLLVVILVMGGLLKATIDKKHMDSMKYELSKYDNDIFEFLDIVNYSDISDYTNLSESEIIQNRLDRLMQNLKNNATEKYNSIDEAYIGEVNEYESSKSIESLINICYIINIRK